MKTTEQKRELSPHQALLLEMLKDFDAACRKHAIRYQLFAGTALGAVRLTELVFQKPQCMFPVP